MTARKRLRSGFTTGTAAAAAVKGALRLLAEGRVPEAVHIPFLTEGHADIRPVRCETIRPGQVLCTVIKDGGDDPDVTNGAEIGAVVTLGMPGGDVTIRGGRGVGRVTKPGLGLELNGPAITQGPEQMIRMAVADVFGPEKTGVDIEIFVENGETLAEKTLNARLGVLGGISILGTTGIVRPLSHEAYIATIGSALSVASSSGLDRVVFTTGRRSERYAMGLFPDMKEEAFIQIGDFFKASLEAAAHAGMKEIILAVFFGKAVKMAQGTPHTHAARSDMSLDALASWTFELTKNDALARDVRSANTARHAFEMIFPVCPAIAAKVGGEVRSWALRFAGERTAVRVVMFDFDGHMIHDSALTGGAK